MTTWFLCRALLTPRRRLPPVGIKQPNRSPVEKLSDLGEPLTARDRNSRTLSMTGATGATSYMELPALDPEELAADVAKETSKKLWMEPLTYTEKVKVSLARALIMNPDLLVLHRPFHHFDLATADDVLAVPRDDGHLGEGPRFSPRLCPQKVVRFPSRKNLPKMAPVLCVCVFWTRSLFETGCRVVYYHKTTVCKRSNGSLHQPVNCAKSPF
ncbi:unnamed protein product [Effrenium voratum]|uniref:Uncharacterized protein n=1 Tax=Effrenium voratum TaxID=2562239 RepID=A0AA36IFL0_9DINO|nr:unnamed protein product [Effrenium voratum]